MNFNREKNTFDYFKRGLFLLFIQRYKPEVRNTIPKNEIMNILSKRSISKETTYPNIPQAPNTINIFPKKHFVDFSILYYSFLKLKNL